MGIKQIEANKKAAAKGSLVRNVRNNKLYINHGYFPNGVKPDDFDSGVYLLMELFSSGVLKSISAKYYHEKVGTGTTGTLPRFIDVQKPPAYNPVIGEPNKATELYYSSGKPK